MASRQIQHDVDFRELVASWADERDLDATQLFLVAMGFALMLAFGMGSNRHVTTETLHDLVDQASELYGPLVGPGSIN